MTINSVHDEMHIKMDLFPEHLQPRLGQSFEEGLRTHSWSSELEPFYSRLRATDKIIYEVTDGQQPLANALWDLCFPRFSQAELWHYTSLSNLKNILQKGEIWLHPMVNRMSEGELTHFASEFGYRGLFDVDADGARVADKLATDLYYLSLTDQDDPGDLWNYGEVRLRLRVSPVQSRAELRQLRYGAGGNHPLNLLTKFAQEHFGRHFVPWRVSRMGSFFLDPYYSWESEVRLLIKRFEETSDLTLQKSGEHDAVAIAIGKPNDRVLIDLVCIETETQASLENVRALIAKIPSCIIPVHLHSD